jgi:hypothetical protein
VFAAEHEATARTKVPGGEAERSWKVGRPTHAIDGKDQIEISERDTWIQCCPVTRNAESPKFLCTIDL